MTSYKSRQFISLLKMFWYPIECPRNVRLSVALHHGSLHFLQALFYGTDIDSTVENKEYLSIHTLTKLHQINVNFFQYFPCVKIYLNIILQFDNYFKSRCQPYYFFSI